MQKVSSTGTTRTRPFHSDVDGASTSFAHTLGYSIETAKFPTTRKRLLSAALVCDGGAKKVAAKLSLLVVAEVRPGFHSSIRISTRRYKRALFLLVLRRPRAEFRR